MSITTFIVIAITGAALLFRLQRMTDEESKSPIGRRKIIEVLIGGSLLLAVTITVPMIINERSRQTSQPEWVTEIHATIPDVVGIVTDPSRSKAVFATSTGDYVVVAYPGREQFELFLHSGTLHTFNGANHLDKSVVDQLVASYIATIAAT